MIRYRFDVALPPAPEISKACVRCGASFVTRARNKKRCDPCQEIAKQIGIRKNNAKHEAKRKAARAQKAA